MKIKIGIDASRNRSGGARAHIIGILTALDTIPDEVEELHIWSYQSLLDLLPNKSWIIKHSHKALGKSLLNQLLWQYFILSREAKRLKVDILLNTDAGSICRFRPSVTMSRDMLSYEKGEINRFGFSLAGLRLYILRFVQNRSLKASEGVIFLTEYAAKIIQNYCGQLSNFTIIPHGVSSAFRISSNFGQWRRSENQPIKCIYVSNVELYKHQWIVIKAIEYLRKQGYNLSITFVGGGDGKAQKLFDHEVLKYDPNKEYINKMEFIEHSKIPNLISQSDIFIFASSCENMPNTLVEGMSAGLPIASSDRGPMPEVLKEGGIYFDPENYISIALAIKTIIDSDIMRLKISKRAQELSVQYSWLRCAKETFAFMIETLKRKNNLNI
jgi:glycosyltransferase involved in cell wall biosynthesis